MMTKNMKHIASIILIIISAAFLCCHDDGAGTPGTGQPKEGFISDSEYELVCTGYPKPGLTGVQKTESAKRAALLNAYYLIQQKFDDSVLPDRDGRIKTFTMFEDHGEMAYIVTKDNLKNRLKK